MSATMLREARLGACADFEMGQAPPGEACNFLGDGTLFVKAGEFGRDLPIEREWTTRPLKFGKVGDVFICVVGATAGKLNLGIECAIGRSVAAIRPKEELDTKFLYYQLKLQTLHLRADSSGSAQGVISKSDLQNIKIKAGPIAVQHQIVAKIDDLFSDLDAGIESLERARAKLKRYRASVLKSAVEGRLTQDWRAKNTPKESGAALLKRILKTRREKWEAAQLKKFADAGKVPPNGWNDKYPEPLAPDLSTLESLPQGWCWASVDQISEIQSGIQKQPKRAPVKNAFPFLRVANVARNELRLDDVHQIELFKGELERLRLEAGDILIVEGNGSKSEIGRSAIWDGSIENCVHQNHLIRVRVQATLPAFFNLLWNSPFGKVQVSDVAASTSGLYTLSTSKIAAMFAPLPPLAEQKEIIGQVDDALSAIARAESDIEAQLVRGALLKQSILKRAFEGRLV